MNIEDNKLIAEFVGYKIENKRFQSLEYHSSNESHWEWNEGEIVTLNGNEVCDSSQEPFYSLEDLPFDSDWNWLMEVVEKIESLGYRTSIIKSMIDLHIMLIKDSEDNHYREHSSFEVEQTLYANTKIQAVYNACLEFIKWYNETFLAQRNLD